MIDTHLHEARLVRREAAGGAVEHDEAVLVDDLLDGDEAVAAGLREAGAVGRAARARGSARALAL